MLTDAQIEILTKIIDHSWEIKQTLNSNVRETLIEKVIELKADLKESIGEELYEKFLENGTEIFKN